MFSSNTTWREFLNFCYFIVEANIGLILSRAICTPDVQLFARNHVA